MSNSDTWQPQWADILASIGLLSRLPVRIDANWVETRGANQCWAYALAGVLVGAITILVASLSMMLHLPDLAIGFIIVATTAYVTGAIHYDGLADSLDGLWGGWTQAQRLDIMKDSHIGVYGVIGVVCLVGLQATLYGHIVTETIWPVLGVMAMSRAVMVPVMTWLKNAKTSGLSAQVGRPSVATAILALIVGTCVALLSGAWPAIFGSIIAALAVGKIAKHKIGGQTGDILGAIQQLAEVCSLIFVIALA